MDKKNLMPQAAQPVNRTTTGQLPTELAELSEEALQLYGEENPATVIALGTRVYCNGGICSYDGDEAE